MIQIRQPASESTITVGAVFESRRSPQQNGAKAAAAMTRDAPLPDVVPVPSWPRKAGDEQLRWHVMARAAPHHDDAAPRRGDAPCRVAARRWRQRRRRSCCGWTAALTMAVAWWCGVRDKVLLAIETK